MSDGLVLQRPAVHPARESLSAHISRPMNIYIYIYKCMFTIVITCMTMDGVSHRFAFQHVIINGIFWTCYLNWMGQHKPHGVISSSLHHISCLNIYDGNDYTAEKPIYQTLPNSIHGHANCNIIVIMYLIMVSSRVIALDKQIYIVLIYSPFNASNSSK